MNPWQSKRIALRTTELGGLEDFCEVASVAVEPRESEMVALQDALFRLMDSYRQLNASAKAQNDIEKYGEFISNYEMDYKIKLLKRLTEHLAQIVDSKDLLISALARESRGNCIVVDNDKQFPFIEFLQLASQGTSFYSLLSEAAQMHDSTMQRVADRSNEILAKGGKCQETEELYWGLARQVRSFKALYDV
mmetsp:Transcript_19110/g.34781  ORF Transcript_19110/g.34781 Transcript_19110/m.34781 type:complete len:192 (+) Transcript_19110:1380-1955(+)